MNSASRAHIRMAHFTSALAAGSARSQVQAHPERAIDLQFLIPKMAEEAPTDLYKCWQNLTGTVASDKAALVYAKMVGSKDIYGAFGSRAWSFRYEFYGLFLSVSILQQMMTSPLYQRQFQIAFQKVQSSLGTFYSTYKEKLGVQDDEITSLLIQKISTCGEPQQRVRDLLDDGGLRPINPRDMTEDFYQWIMEVIINRISGEIWEAMCVKYEAEITAALTEESPEMSHMFKDKARARQFLRNAVLKEHRTRSAYQLMFDEFDTKLSAEEKSKKIQVASREIMCSTHWMGMSGLK